jgi:hypothetical protein
LRQPPLLPVRSSDAIAVERTLVDRSGSASRSWRLPQTRTRSTPAAAGAAASSSCTR